MEGSLGRSGRQFSQCDLRIASFTGEDCRLCSRQLDALSDFHCRRQQILSRDQQDQRCPTDNTPVSCWYCGRTLERFASRLNKSGSGEGHFRQQNHSQIIQGGIREKTHDFCFHPRYHLGDRRWRSASKRRSDCQSCRATVHHRMRRMALLWKFRDVYMRGWFNKLLHILQSTSSMRLMTAWILSRRRLGAASFA